MPWWLVAIFVASFVATLLLTPKPKVENARAQGLDDLRFPTASEGAPVPLLFGRSVIRGPNTIWSGDFEARPIKKKIKTGLFSSKTVIVGYEYFVGLQMCLALGPCTLHSIRSDKDILWSGTANTDGAAVTINLPMLYGGRESGGGFVSNSVYYTGSATQTADSYLQAQLGAANVPGYRGFAYIVFPKANIGESNQLRAMEFELSRYTNGLGFTGGMEKIGDDMNPMELLFQAFALEFGGLAIPTAMLDMASMKTCGETLFAESNGMSLTISSPNGGKDIANEVLRQADAILYQDPLTAKIVVRLIRNDYNVEDLPVFDESNIIAIRSFSSKMWEDTINQVRINFTDREKRYGKGTAIAQDLANIGAQEQMRTATMSYPGVHVPELANDLAARDLSQASVPLMGASMELNRKAANLRPGDPFVWSWGPYGIEQAIMRVKTFDLGALNDNRIAVEVTQDEFAVGLTVFAAPSGAGSSIVRPAPLAPESIHLMEAPYWLMQKQEELALPPSAGNTFVLVHARTALPLGAGYQTSITQGSETVVSDSVPYTETAVLDAGIAISDGFATGVIASLVVELYRPGDEALGAGSLTTGQNLFGIGNELMLCESATDLGAGSWQLNNVRRALLDTTYSAHASGAVVYFLAIDALLLSELEGSSLVSASVTGVNPFGTSSAMLASITTGRRYERPLPPDNVQVNGARAYNPSILAGTALSVSWVARSRLDAAIKHETEAASAPEAGQTYNLRWYLGATLKATHTGVTSPFVISPTVADAGSIRIEIDAVRDGLASYNPAIYYVDSIDPPPADPGPWRYFRLNITAVQADNYVSLMRFEVRPTVGGADVLSGKTATASSTGFGWTPDRAVNTNDSDGWHSGDNVMPDWLQVDLGAGNTSAAAEFGIFPRPTDTNQRPRDFQLLGSNDGVNWSVIKTITGQTSWTTGVLNLFTV